MDQNKHNFIPPSSRMTNYVVLKFGDLCDVNVSLLCSALFFMICWRNTLRREFSVTELWRQHKWK